MFAEFLDGQEQQGQEQEQQGQEQQEQATEHPDTLPLQTRLPTHSQPCSSAADEFTLDWWGELIGDFSYYGSSGYAPFGEGGSRPAGAPRSEDEDRDDDYDDDE